MGNGETPMKAMIWPVYGFTETSTLRGQVREVVATFFSWGDAADFAMSPQAFGAEKRNLYIGEGRARPQ